MPGLCIRRCNRPRIDLDVLHEIDLAPIDQILRDRPVDPESPSRARDLHATSSDLVWINATYITIYGSTILISGTLGDRFGRKKLLLSGMMIFMLGLKSHQSLEPTRVGKPPLAAQLQR